MRKLFSFVFICLWLNSNAQTFKVNSEAGEILLNDNYINIPPYGIKRVKVKQINPSSDDIYSWQWIYHDTEFHFEVRPGQVFLVRKKIFTGEIIQTIKILKNE
jgi:hypothetical protein